MCHFLCLWGRLSFFFFFFNCNYSWKRSWSCEGLWKWKSVWWGQSGVSWKVSWNSRCDQQSDIFFFVELHASLFGWTSVMLKSFTEMLAHPSMCEQVERKGVERGRTLSKKKKETLESDWISHIHRKPIRFLYSRLDTVWGLWPADVHHGV